VTAARPAEILTDGSNDVLTSRSPREHGVDTVDAIRAMRAREALRSAA
jgi:hypothetical protein